MPAMWPCLRGAATPEAPISRTRHPATGHALDCCRAGYRHSGNADRRRANTAFRTYFLGASAESWKPGRYTSPIGLAENRDAGQTRGETRPAIEARRTTCARTTTGT